MNIFTFKTHVTNKMLVLLALVSLLLTSLPIGLMTAFAATVYGPDSVTLDQATSTYSSAAIDASGHENLMLSFDYDAESFDDGDSFVYGWREVGGSDNNLGTFNGLDDSGTSTATDEIGSISVGLPSGAEIANLEIYLVANVNSGSDAVAITNLEVSGDVLSSPASPTAPYSNGFEVDTDDWTTVTQLSSGTNGISSATGNFHAEADVNDYTRWGGYESDFPAGGYYTEIDVYLDMGLADGAVDKRFDFSSAINNSTGSHLRDFIFHLGTDPSNAGQWLVSASNNAPGWPGNPARSPVTVNQSGWYTLQHQFLDNAGVLEVRMNLIRISDGSVEGTWVLSDAGDLISNVGGNRYGWFTSQRFDFDWMAIDNARKGTTASPTLPPPPKPEVNEVVSGNTYNLDTGKGWLFNRDTNTASEFEFNTDQSVIGSGALYVEPVDGSLNGNSDKFIGELFLLENMNNITAISYDYQLSAGVPSGKANEFYANVYANFDDSNDYGHCVYNVVPTDGSAGWHTMTFDPTMDYDVRQRGSSPQTCPDSPSDMGPNAELRMFAINVGDTSNNDLNVGGYFDKVVVETADQITTFDFEPDTTKPVTEVLSPEDGLVTNTNFDITVRSTDNVEVSQMVVNLKDSVGANLSSCLNESVSGTDETRSCTVDIGVLGEGNFGFKANAKDSSNNTSNTVSQSFTVDTSKPDVAIVTPANNEVINSADVDVSGTASDTWSDISHVLYTVTEITALGGTYVGNFANGTTTGTTAWEFSLTDMDAGFYRVKVQAFDEAGNWKYKYHDIEIAPDTEAPNLDAITVNGQSVDLGHVRMANCEAVVSPYLVNDILDFEATLSDDMNEVASASYKVRKVSESGCSNSGVFSSGKVNLFEDGGVWEANEGQEFDTNETGASGLYTIMLTTTDSIGNQAVRYVDIMIDNDAPTVPTGLAWTDSESNDVPSGQTTALQSGTASWSANNEDDFSHYVYHIWNDIDGSPYNGESSAWTTETTGTSRGGAFGQGEGTYYFCISAVDKLGNESECSGTLTIIYEVEDEGNGGGGEPTPNEDVVDPVVEINNVVVSSDKRLSFDLTATDDDSGLEIVSANIYNETNTGSVLVAIGRLNVPFDGLPEGTLSFATSTSDIDVSSLADGAYTIRAYARDHAGNEHRFLLLPLEIVTVVEPEVVPSSLGGGPVLGGSDTGNPAVLGASTSEPDGEVLGDTDTAGSCGMYLLEYMSATSNPSVWEVMKLQLFLVSKGLASTASGLFDNGTESAVRQYQADNSSAILDPWVTAGLADSLSPTGNVYKTTRWHINNAVCPGSEVFPQLP